jgi:nitrous oxide reductase accessory protein NosL
MKTRSAVLAFTIAASWMAGCVRVARSPEPVPVDHVECAFCHMLISTHHGGGQIVSANEDTRFYDDVLCLAADWASHRRGDARAYVRLAGGAWHDAIAAVYAQPAASSTATESGVVAFATAEEARAADRAGRVLTWKDLLALTGDDR